MTDNDKYCTKAEEIAQMQTDLEAVKKAVMGNGKDGLIVTVPLLSQSVMELKETTGDLKTGVNGFLKYQQTMEGKQGAKEEMRKRTRWLVGILISIMILLAGGLVTTIHLLVR